MLHGVLEGAKGLIHGVTCGAGMPYKPGRDRRATTASTTTRSSPPARAFRALWKRAYPRPREWLGGVVYEDPWLAGGHNGLSNAEDPQVPEDPYPRVLKLREQMREFGLDDVPIIMAGGVWYLREWEDWIDNPELGPIAFQFGTRPLLTQESPISDAWKQRLLTLEKGDVLLHPFSPTGFYSSAVRNAFLRELEDRNERQVAYTSEAVGEHLAEYGVGPRKRTVFLAPARPRAREQWEAEGFTEALRTPDNTLIFVTPDQSREIREGPGRLHGLPVPVPLLQLGRSTSGILHRQEGRSAQLLHPEDLQDIAHDGAIDHNLMFAGHNAYRFGRTRSTRTASCPP